MHCESPGFGSDFRCDIKVTPIKQVLASEQVKSRYLGYLISITNKLITRINGRFHFIQTYFFNKVIVVNQLNIF